MIVLYFLFKHDCIAGRYTKCSTKTKMNTLSKFYTTYRPLEVDVAEVSSVQLADFSF